MLIPLISLISGCIRHFFTFDTTLLGKTDEKTGSGERENRQVSKSEQTLQRRTIAGGFLDLLGAGVRAVAFCSHAIVSSQQLELTRTDVDTTAVYIPDL